MVKCPKCNKKIKIGDSKFCIHCGTKLNIKETQRYQGLKDIKTLEEKKEQHPKKEINKEKIKTKKYRIFHLLIPLIVFGSLLILACILLLPTKMVGFQIEVPYIEKEQYTIEVPYETVEPYTVQVPYETKEQYVESLPYTETELKYYSGCDENQNCICLHYSYWGMGACDQCSCTVTKYKDVIKERTVTKYKDETRYRTITKMRTETREREVRKTRTETKYKEVNWLFGFDAIIKFRG